MRILTALCRPSYGCSFLIHDLRLFLLITLLARSVFSYFTVFTAQAELRRMVIKKTLMENPLADFTHWALFEYWELTTGVVFTWNWSDHKDSVMIQTEDSLIPFNTVRTWATKAGFTKCKLLFACFHPPSVLVRAFKV